MRQKEGQEWKGWGEKGRIKGGEGLERKGRGKGEIRRERKLGTALGSGRFIILCSTQSNTGPLNREQCWRIILGAFSPPPLHPSLSSSFSIPTLLTPPTPPLSLCLFFLRCMSAIHLSAVSASERYTELSLRVSPGLGGPFFAAAAAAAAHCFPMAAQKRCFSNKNTSTHTWTGIRQILVSRQCSIDNYYKDCCLSYLNIWWSSKLFHSEQYKMIINCWKFFSFLLSVQIYYRPRESINKKFCKRHTTEVKLGSPQSVWTKKEEQEQLGPEAYTTVSPVVHGVSTVQYRPVILKCSLVLVGFNTFFPVSQRYRSNVMDQERLFVQQGKCKDPDWPERIFIQLHMKHCNPVVTWWNVW